MNGAALLAFLLLHFACGFLPRMPSGPFLYGPLHGLALGISRRLDRTARAPRDLFMRGAVVAVFMTALAFCAGGAVDKIARQPYGWAAAIAFLFCAVSVVPPLNRLRAAAKELKHDAKNQGAFTLARQAAERSAAALNIWCAGPLFWFAVLGAKGAALYLAAAALYEGFSAGTPAFRAVSIIIFRLLNVVPALLTVTGIALAALFVSRSSPVRALKTALEHPADMPLAAMAGALGVTLGGPPRGWIGPKDSSAKVAPEELDRCAMIHYVFFLCLVALTSAGILLTYLPAS